MSITRYMRPKKKDDFKDSTFLYIRAFEGDNGNRPIPSDIIHWLSPDIEVFMNDVQLGQSPQLEPDTDYVVVVTVRNDGDMDCYCCNVDLFLCNPTIGFTSADNRLIGMHNVEVMAHSYTDIRFPFRTDAGTEGHFCLFARAYSMSSNDYPADMINFSTRNDRHIGQQNLNIVKQNTIITLELNYHFKQKRKNLHLLIDNATDFNTNDSVFKKKYDFTKRKILPDRFKFKVKGANVSDRVPGLEFISQVSDKKLISRHMFEPGVTKLDLIVPDLGLDKDEAIPINVCAVEPQTNEVIGGVTIIVVG